MSELSRVEDLLKTGVEEPVLPMSRLEAILRGEKITPQSRVEELLLQYNPSDILIEKRITANGTYFAVNDNADGYFKVVVDTPVVPPTVLDHLVETITENGTYTYTPEHDGFEDAEITVDVPSVTPVLDDITITENGVYTSEHDGFGIVTVDVAGGGGEVIDISSLFGNLVVNAQFATGSWVNGVFSFDVDDYANYWTSFVSLTSMQLDFTNLNKLSFDADIIDQQDYSELAVIISPVYYTWGSSDWPGIFSESNKVANYYTTSGSYEIDTHLITGNNYIYIIAYSSDHNHSGNEYNGLIEGTVSNICVTEAGLDSNIYLMDGSITQNEGSKRVTPDKAFDAGSYVVSLYSNNKSFTTLLHYNPASQVASETYTFTPGMSGSYSCNITWDGYFNIACSTGSWFDINFRVSKVPDDFYAKTN